MTAVTEQVGSLDIGPIRRAFAAMRTFIVGTLLCLTPAGAILVLGWLTGDMARASKKRLGAPEAYPDRTGWLMGSRGKGWLNRVLGGLVHNIRSGLNMTLCLFAATLPFTGLWLSAWWAGWENSFNKGYEQAFVGPILGFSGVALFAFIMIYLPMAIAHQAAENRAFAFFELRRVRSAVAHTGWWYVALALTTLIFALPLYAGRGLPVFAESIIPGLADMSGQEIANLKLMIGLALAAYVFVSLVILRRWLARIYADAVRRAATGKDHDLWASSALSGLLPDAQERRQWRLFRIPRFLIQFMIWIAFAFVIFFGQFLNHDWHLWATHPYFFLPWPG